MKKFLFLVFAIALCTISKLYAQVETGLPVPLALQKNISTKSARKGDLIKFVVMSEVYNSDGDLVIPEGAIAYGTVASRKSRMIFGKGAAMEIVVDYVTHKNGTRIPIYADSMMTKGKNNKITKTLGIAGFFIVGTWPLIFVPGKHAKFDAGTVVQAYTR